MEDTNSRDEVSIERVIKEVEVITKREGIKKLNEQVSTVEQELQTLQEIEKEHSNTQLGVISVNK